MQEKNKERGSRASNKCEPLNTTTGVKYNLKTARCYQTSFGQTMVAMYIKQCGQPYWLIVCTGFASYLVVDTFTSIYSINTRDEVPDLMRSLNSHPTTVVDTCFKLVMHSPPLNVHGFINVFMDWVWPELEETLYKADMPKIQSRPIFILSKYVPIEKCRIVHLWSSQDSLSGL